MPHINIQFCFGGASRYSKTTCIFRDFGSISELMKIKASGL